MKFIVGLLVEAIQSIHYTKRVIGRFVTPDKITVGYEIPNSYGMYEEVGTYIIPQELKNSVIENTQIVEDYKFPANKSYAIKIADIYIDKNKVNYFTESLKNKALNGSKKLLFLDKETDSNGDQIYAVIRDNKITTAFFGKSYSMKDIKGKMRVDVFINNIKDFVKEKETAIQKKPVNTTIKILSINGVKWAVDMETEKIYKKNKPDTKYDVYQFVEKLPQNTQDEILSFLIN